MAEELVLQILKAIVTNPDKVDVTRTVDGLGVLFTIDVAEEDAGAVIGKGGATIKAIRTIARIIGLKNQELINIKINA